jgi:tetratricopeptide (TPR) repeat protein
MGKRLATLAVMMGLSACVMAQTAGQTPAQPGTPEQPGVTGTQPGQPPQAGQPSGRPPVQAKTQAEFQAYQAAIANAQNPDAMEKAADDFSAKFPTSDLRVLLYRAAMHTYQSAGNSQKMMEMGLKVLAIDRDDPEALIGVAEVQEEHTSPSDLDREERMTQAITNAQRALETIDTDLAVPAGTPPARVEEYKKYLRATALTIVGTIEYKRQQFGNAESTLRKAIDADSSHPDAVVILRLALALDQEKKYPEALEQANRAVELTKEDTDIGKMARNERDRLMIQTGQGNGPGGGAAPAGAAAGGNAPSSNGAPGNPAPPANAAPPSANVPPNPPPPSH